MPCAGGFIFLIPHPVRINVPHSSVGKRCAPPHVYTLRYPQIHFKKFFIFVHIHIDCVNNKMHNFHLIPNINYTADPLPLTHHQQMCKFTKYNLKGSPGAVKHFEGLNLSWSVVDGDRLYGINKLFEPLIVEIHWLSRSLGQFNWCRMVREISFGALKSANYLDKANLYSRCFPIVLLVRTSVAPFTNMV